MEFRLFRRLRALPDLTIESIIIVISILLAFSIDAWWDGYQDTKKESVVLAQMKKELLLYKGLIEYAAQVGQVRRERIDKLLTAIHSEEIMPTEDFSLYVISLKSNYRLDAAAATFEILMGDASFGLISDPNLKQALSDVSSYLSLVGEFELEETGFINQNYTPFINRYVDRFGSKDSAKHLAETAPSKFTSDINFLIESREFSNLLIERRSHIDSVENFRNGLKKSIDEALKIFDKA